MKHAIIVGHPDVSSVSMALAEGYANAVAKLGHTSILRDLYRLDFDPRLPLSELPTRARWRPAPDIERERALLADVDVFTFIYPLWFNAPPAIIKGYIERTFGVGFGYEDMKGGGQGPLLSGRQLLHITTSGSTHALLNEQGAWLSMRHLFEDYFAKICGIRVRPHIHFDAVAPGLEARWVATFVNELDNKVRSYFGDPTEAGEQGRMITPGA